MNGLFAAIVIILIVFTVIGYYKGCIRTIFSLISYIILIGLVSWLSPHVTNFIEKNTPIYSMIHEKCEETIRIETSNEIDKKIKNEEPIEIGGFRLPEAINRQIKEKSEDVSEQMIESSGFSNIAADYIAGFILNGIAFLVTLVLVSAILRFVINLLDLIAKLPVIKGINQILGGAAGFMEGIVITWLIFFVITLMSTSEIGKQMINQINENQFLQFLYKNNPIMSLIQYFFQP